MAVVEGSALEGSGIDEAFHLMIKCRYLYIKKFYLKQNFKKPRKIIHSSKKSHCTSNRIRIVKKRNVVNDLYLWVDIFNFYREIKLYIFINAHMNNANLPLFVRKNFTRYSLRQYYNLFERLYSQINLFPEDTTSFKLFSK